MWLSLGSQFCSPLTLFGCSQRPAKTLDPPMLVRRDHRSFVLRLVINSLKLGLVEAMTIAKLGFELFACHLQR